MKILNKPFLIAFLLFTILFSILTYSVYNPKLFLKDNLSSDIELQLKSFSFVNPKYTGIQYDSGYDRYNVYDLEFQRNIFLGWNIIENKTIKNTVLKADLPKYQSEIKNGSSVSNNTFFQDKYIINDNDTFEQKEYKRAWHPPSRSNSIHYNLDKFKSLKKI